MKIGIKSELHSVVSSLKSNLALSEIPVKTTKLQEVFANALGYKTFNGLLHALPIEIGITDAVDSKFEKLLKEKFNLSEHQSMQHKWLHQLDDKHETYSSHYSSDKSCYPTSLRDGENYWYLMEDGWKQWSEMDFSTMKVELNIFEVAVSQLWGDPEKSFGGHSCRPIWDASIASFEFENKAERLIRQYGHTPPYSS
ncbi:hypothetical protein KW478_19625 [Vibrio fluvialis]|nr:hypothetical protein [Vibrio fluvialis]